MHEGRCCLGGPGRALAGIGFWTSLASLTRATVALGLAATSAGGAQAAEMKPFKTEVVKLHREVGMASFYRATGRTASGVPAGGMSAAHRKLPFGSHVTVRDLKTGREVDVVITDRGPFKRSRVIDLSHQAAQKLGITGRGLAMVEVVSQ